MGHPSLYSLSEAAEFLGVSEMVVKDFIDCGDLATVGSQKEHIRLVDLNKFLGEEPASLQNQERPVDFSGKQRSNVPCSILIEDISEEEWETMKREEHKPYFDEQKQRWCIALSLGKDENGRRKRKIISGKSQMEVWESYKEYIQQHSREIALVCSDTPIVREGIAAGLRIASYEPEQDVTVRECFPEFLRTVRRRVKDRTYGDYLNASKYILEHLGDKRMYEINRSVLEKFFDELAQDKYAKGKETEPTHYYGQSKINKVYDLVRRFTKYYSDAGRGSQLLKMDFAANIDKPKAIRNGPRHIPRRIFKKSCKRSNRIKWSTAGSVSCWRPGAVPVKPWPSSGGTLTLPERRFLLQRPWERAPTSRTAS